MVNRINRSHDISTENLNINDMVIFKSVIRVINIILKKLSIPSDKYPNYYKYDILIENINFLLDKGGIDKDLLKGIVKSRGPFMDIKSLYKAIEKEIIFDPDPLIYNKGLKGIINVLIKGGKINNERDNIVHKNEDIIDYLIDINIIK